MTENTKKGRLERWPLFLLTAGAFLGTYGVGCLGRAAGLDRPFFTALQVLVFAAVWHFLNLTRRDLGTLARGKARRRRTAFAAVAAFLLALSFLTGWQLQTFGMTQGGAGGKARLLFQTLCLAAAFFPLGNFFFRRADAIRPARESGSGAGAPARLIRSGAVFAVCAGCIFLCLIPVWLAYYPIIMSYDFHRQVNEAHNGFAYFYPYQPIAHTWVIWVFLKLGEALGSLEAGYAFMALLQMLLYALVTGYACAMLYRIVKKTWAVVTAVVYFGVFPFQSVMVVCTTKDVLFTVLFLLFFLLLTELCLFSGRGRREGQDSAPGRLSRLRDKRNLLAAALVLEGCLTVQFRNNAFYAVAVFAVLSVFLVPKRQKLRVLLLGALLIGGSKAAEIGIREAIGTQLTVPKVEMFSVPIQQFARVGYYHGSELDEFTALELDGYVPWQDWSHYNPPLADTVKGSVRSESFSGDYGKLISFWAKMGLRYPDEYVDAFLELTRGYWFLDDTSWAENLGSGVEGRMGALFTYNSSEIPEVGSIEHESKLPWLEEQLEKIVSGNAFYDWPLISLPFRSAFYPWSLFLVTMVFWYKGQRRQLWLSLLVWLYFGTVLLGPVVQLRYVFPLMAVLPLLVAMLYHNENHRLSAPPPAA